MIERRVALLRDAGVLGSRVQGVPGGRHGLVGLDVRPCLGDRGLPAGNDQGELLRIYGDKRIPPVDGLFIRDLDAVSDKGSDDHGDHSHAATPRPAGWSGRTGNDLTRSRR